MGRDSGADGENGAGKSTLMKIVYGLVSPDEGSIQVDGQPAKIHSPADAIRLGIGMVHQHFMLVDPLTVTENVVLGAEPGHLFQVDFRRARAEVAQLIAEMGFHLDPDARVEDLPVGLQQRVEILKMLYRKARILILDEPTAVLTPQEAGELFAFLRRFARRGSCHFHQPQAEGGNATGRPRHRHSGWQGGGDVAHCPNRCPGTGAADGGAGSQSDR